VYKLDVTPIRGDQNGIWRTAKLRATVEIEPKMQKAIFPTGPFNGPVQWSHWRIQRSRSMAPFNGPVRLAQSRLELLFQQTRTRVHDSVLMALRGSGRF
jgi:hypothetical protein